LKNQLLFRSYKKRKWGKLVFFFAYIYGRFLSINRASTIATTMMRTNRPAIAGTKYMSATDVGVVVGAGVAPGADTTIAEVSAHEP
jgi:hypothetical protein